MADVARAFTMADVDAARQFIASRTIHYRMGDTGEAARAAAFNLNPIAAVRTANMIAAGEEATGGRAVVTEAWRSDATQAVYKANQRGRPITYNGVTYRPDTYVNEKGKTVERRTSYPTASPGRSNHREGGAVDFSSYGDAGAVRSWMVRHSGEFGMQPIKGDDPHLQVNESVPLSADEADYVVRTLGYESVEDFQSKNGLDADGVVGKNTTGAMYREIVAPSVAAAEDPNAKPYTVYSADIQKAEKEGKLTAAPPMTVAEARQHAYAGDPFGVAKSKESMVASRPSIELSPADRDVAIRTVLAEGDTPDAQTAIAHVIANRYDQGYGPSVAAIAGDETEFPGWTGDKPLAYGPGTPEYEAAGKIVDEVFTRRPEPPPAVGNSTEFYAGEEEPAGWKGAVQKVGQVGKMVFGAVANAVNRPKSFMLRQTKGGEPDPRVVALQTQLKQAGVFQGDVDGRYGPQTTAAVKAWQKQSGQRPTGVADTNTLRTLRLPASEAGFQKMFLVNPETPANRAKLFPEGQPRPPQADAVEEALAYDPLEQLRGGEGKDVAAPSISKDRLGADDIDGGQGTDRPLPTRTADRLGMVDPSADWRPTPPTPPRRPDRPAPAPAPAPAAGAAAGLTVRVKRGDTFGKLAKEHLGDANRWQEIADANPGIKARSIPIGSEINIPGKSGPPAPRPKPDTSTVLNDFNPSSTSGPSIETIRKLGLTPAVWDNLATDVFGGTDRTGAAIDDDPNVITEADVEQLGRAMEIGNDRLWFEKTWNAGELRPQGTPPPIRQSSPSSRMGNPPPPLRPDSPSARMGNPVAPGSLSIDEIDRQLAEMRQINAGREVARLPADMNRSGGAAWGESYEETPSFLTDIGFYDTAPERGRSPDQLSLDAMPERVAESTARSDSPSVTTFEQPAGAPRIERPTGDASSYATWGVPWDPLDVAAMPLPGEEREPTVAPTGEGADRSKTWSQPDSGQWMTDDRPKAAAPPATSQAPAKPKSATITVNGTAYEYDRPSDSAEAIDNMLGIQTPVVEPLSYVEPVAGSAMAAPAPPSAETTEFTRPDPVNMMALANEEAKRSPGTVTPPKSQPASPSSPAGGAAAASGTQQPAQSGGGITSPTNPNFTGTSVETNPITGQQYAVGTWKNGARAIAGENWTAVENPDGTFSYAGNPLSNISFGGSPT